LRACKKVVKIAGSPPTGRALATQCPGPGVVPDKGAISEGRAVVWHIPAAPRLAIPMIVVPSDEAVAGRAGGASPYANTLPSAALTQ